MTKTITAENSADQLTGQSAFDVRLGVCMSVTPYQPVWVCNAR